VAVGAIGGEGALGVPAVRRPGVGAETSGAPSPTDGIGARPPSPTDAGPSAGGGAAWGAGGSGAAGCTGCGRGAGAAVANP
jgi:hypothetical protein